MTSNGSDGIGFAKVGAVGVVMALTGLLLIFAVIPAKSSASSIRDYHAFACGGNCMGNAIEAFVNKPFSLGLSFETRNSIQEGDVISLRLPDGNKFDRVTEVVLDTPHESDRLPSELSEDKRTLKMTVTQYISETKFGYLIVGRYEPMITAVRPGPFKIQMWTTTDVDPFVDKLPLYVSPAPSSKEQVLPVRIKSGPSGKISRSNVKFRFAVNFAVNRFECRLDEREWRKCKSPVSYKVKPGRHVFRVRAVDAGSVGSITRSVFTRIG